MTDYGFNPDVELPGGEWRVTYASMFAHLTGRERNELARGTYGDMAIALATANSKYTDLRLEEVV
jgi:hypothetical protein